MNYFKIIYIFLLQPIKRERVHINIIDIMNVVFYAASILKLGICSGCKHSRRVIMPFFLKPENKFNSHFFSCRGIYIMRYGYI